MIVWKFRLTMLSYEAFTESNFIRNITDRSDASPGLLVTIMFLHGMLPEISILSRIRGCRLVTDEKSVCPRATMNRVFCGGRGGVSAGPKQLYGLCAGLKAGIIFCYVISII